MNNTAEFYRHAVTDASDKRVLLDIVAVQKRFAGVHALRGVSITIREGEIYHLLGENGCGKSTLIKIISGAQPPDEGQLIIGGRVHAKLNALQALQEGIETVYQDLSLLPNLSVQENVALGEQLVRGNGRLLRWLNRAQLAATAERALRAVGLPFDSAFRQMPVEQLPIAIRQLVAIARAIATQARLVIMDEPTTALTQREVDNLIAVVERLRQQGVSVLFVSHKLDECYAIGGQAIVLRDGQKVCQGPIADYTKAQLAELMTGKSLDGKRYRLGVPTEKTVLQVRNLGRGQVFDDVSFDLKAGEILGITGLLDSGRNELALALAGVMPATRGELHLNATKLQLRTPEQAIRQKIAYVPEDRLNEGLFLDKSIHQNIITNVLDKLRGRFGMLDARRGMALSEQTVRELQIATPDVDRPVQSLSGGNQQRVLIGRWLTIKPRVLILHGPTVGVDIGSKDTIYRIVQRLAEDGLAVIFISDDLPELLQNCDRILLLKKGRMDAEFVAEGLMENDLYRALVSDTQTAARL